VEVAAGVIKQKKEIKSTYIGKKQENDHCFVMINIA
jgi:hypothetical protein